MKYPNLLKPGQINRMTIANRIIVGPMERAMADRDGSLNERYINYLVERARGGASLINVESTYVHPRGQGNPFQVGCHADHIIPKLTELTEAVHREGGLVSMELYHAGRQSASTSSLLQPIAPTSIQCATFDPMPVPREMSEDDIEDVIGYFRDAAQRCLSAGVDMIHMHGAHGYLLGQFLSPWSNKRSDSYGGSLENRARFPLAVYGAIRGVVGPDYPIGYRISMEEFLEGGLTLDDSIPFCQMLVDAGINLIDVTGGIYESGGEVFQGPHRTPGGFVATASKLRKAIGGAVPISVTQKLNVPDLAEAVIAEGHADFVSMTRAFHADPHFVRKLEHDKADEISPCIGCLTCLDMLFGKEPAHCAVNPLSTFEGVRSFAIKPVERRVPISVVGGGVAGMTAARLLSLQGHAVTLFEATPRLGGQVSRAALAAHDYGYMVEWLEGQMTKLGVRVHLNTEVSASDLRANGDEPVIIATGATGGYSPLGPIGISVLEAFDRKAEQWRGPVLIVGGEAEGCYLAVHLSKIRPDLDIHILEPGSTLAFNKNAVSRPFLLGQVDELSNVRVLLEHTVEAANDGTAMVLQSRDSLTTAEYATVVINGRRSSSKVYDDLLAARGGVDPRVFRIGDAVAPRDIHAATQEALDVAEAFAKQSTPVPSLA